MEFESTQRSNMDRYPQSPAEANVRSFALKIKEIGKAFKVHLMQAAGSAWQFALSRLLTLAVLLSFILIFASGICLSAKVEFKLELKMEVKSQAITSRKNVVNANKIAKHAQFAVSQVALKAIHWQTTECDCDRNSMEFESTQRSNMDRYPQSPAVRYIFRRLRASWYRRKTYYSFKLLYSYE